MNYILFQFGFVQWRVWPFNLAEITHTTATDWANKEIAGAPIFREWVGEGDETIVMRGKVFPRFFSQFPSTLSKTPRPVMGSGMGDLDVMDEMRRYGQAHILMRGDGIRLGWFVIDRFSRGHQHLDGDGIGQQIDFEASFQRVPRPDAEVYYRNVTMFTPNHG